MTILNPSEIRAKARSLPKDQNRFEVRLAVAIITLFFIGGCGQAAVLIALRARTPLVSVACATQAPTLFALLFFLAGAATVPHLWALVFQPERLADKGPRKLATAGTALASVLWLYLGNIAIPMDVAQWVYFAKAFACILLVGGVYAFSLNSQQVRQNEKPAIG